MSMHAPLPLQSILAAARMGLGTRVPRRPEADGPPCYDYSLRPLMAIVREDPQLALAVSGGEGLGARCKCRAMSPLHSCLHQMSAWQRRHLAAELPPAERPSADDVLDDADEGEAGALRIDRGDAAAPSPARRIPGAHRGSHSHGGGRLDR